MRDELEARGEKFVTTTDSEVLARLIALAPGDNMVMKLRQAMPRLNGAYSLVILTKEKLYAVRDPKGVRPLCIGKLAGNWIVASESCALMTVGADFVREVEPGEIVEIDANRARRRICHSSRASTRPASSSSSISRVRIARCSTSAFTWCASEWARCSPKSIRSRPMSSSDCPTRRPLLPSDTPSNLAFPTAKGLIKNRYIGRTFIQPDQRLRDIGVSLKFNALPRSARRQSGLS